MRIRTFLLVACIVVVPLIAMFSHRVPPAARAAVGRFFRQLSGESRPVATRPLPAAGHAPVPAQPNAPTARPPAPTASAAPGAAGHVPQQPVAPPERLPGSLGRLHDLGAVAIDCRPLPGRTGHVASCRLPVDATGQLERVFQASGADATAAADNLLRDVTVWQRGTAGPGPQPAAMRF